MIEMYMSNEIYRQRLIKDIRDILHEAKNATMLEHAGMEGLIRELAVDRIFRPLLLSGFNIGTGKVCDNEGRLSAQTDLIIYHASILPPVLYSQVNNLGVYPIESVYYTVEVKTKATSTTIKDAFNKSREVVKLNYEGKENVKFRNYAPVFQTFFAFGSDLEDEPSQSETIEKELRRYGNYDPDWEKDPHISVFCIVGKGYFWFDYNKTRWEFYPSTDQHDEIIDFIATVVNTLAVYPPYAHKARLGRYLTRERLVYTRK